MTSDNIEVGSVVAVRFDHRRRPVNFGARIYDGTTFRVSKRKDFGASGVYFELDGAVSDEGVPFTFIADDLEKI